VKTYVVRVGDKSWVGNAESPEEAVRYARVKAGIIADEYWVADWDANITIVPFPPSEATL
jgi:hypothetical protein